MNFFLVTTLKISFYMPLAMQLITPTKCWQNMPQFLFLNVKKYHNICFENESQAGDLYLTVDRH